MAIRVLIVDDEPLARQRIRALLEAEADVEIVGECDDSVVHMLRSFHPNVSYCFRRRPFARIT